MARLLVSVLGIICLLVPYLQARTKVLIHSHKGHDDYHHHVYFHGHDDHHHDHDDHHDDHDDDHDHHDDEHDHHNRCDDHADINRRLEALEALHKDEPHEHHDTDHHAHHAVCVMNPTAGSNVHGIVHLDQDGPDANLTVHAKLEGFDVSGETPQHLHGFHVHAVGDLTDGCNTIGSHYNPDGVAHGLLDSEIKHSGDMGNIECDDNGVTNQTITITHAGLYGEQSWIGRSIVVHEIQDNGGQPTGQAGGKLACCLIGWSRKMLLDV